MIIHSSKLLCSCVYRCNRIGKGFNLSVWCLQSSFRIANLKKVFNKWIQLKLNMTAPWNTSDIFQYLSDHVHSIYTKSIYIWNLDPWHLELYRFKLKRSFLCMSVIWEMQKLTKLTKYLPMELSMSAIKFNISWCSAVSVCHVLFSVSDPKTGVWWRSKFMFVTYVCIWSYFSMHACYAEKKCVSIGLYSRVPHTYSVFMLVGPNMCTHIQVCLCVGVCVRVKADIFSTRCVPSLWSQSTRRLTKPW